MAQIVGHGTSVGAFGLAIDLRRCDRANTDCLAGGLPDSLTPVAVRGRLAGSLWVVQGLCVVWLFVVGHGVCVFGGCESVQC